MGNEKSKQRNLEGKSLKDKQLAKRNTQNKPLQENEDMMSSSASKFEFIISGCDDNNNAKMYGFDPAKNSIINLNKPEKINFYLYSQSIIVKKEWICFTGGTNKSKSIISSEAYLYNKENNDVKLLPHLNQARFSHVSLFFNGKLYVFGGRSNPGDQNILNHCEYLQIFEENSFDATWTIMPSSILKRCTSFAFVYNQEIYLIGGYTGQRKRSKKIEKFSENNNKWEIISLRLLYGAERGLLLPGNNPNEFMIFGGKIRSGDTNLVYIYNLQTETYSYAKEMLHERVLQKGFEDKEKKYIYMLGGDSQHTSEKVRRDPDPLDWKWEKININLSIKDQIKQCSHTQETVLIDYAYEAPINNNDIILPNERIHVLFGTDCEPFIGIFNIDKTKIFFRPVPNPLRLYGYQGVTEISPYKYFICGGLFYSRKKISKDAFIYDVLSHKVLKCQKMQGVRYTMNVVAYNNRVYVIGGRSYGGDQDGILDTCECFDLSINQWKKIASLNKKRCTAMSFVIKDAIYIAGGYNGTLIREKSFETYNETTNMWLFLGVELSEPLEASRVLLYENKVVLLGGRNKQGDSNSCFVYDFSFGIDTMHLESTKRMTNKKCLHKTLQFDGHILIFGGENFNNNKFIEFIGVDTNTDLIVEPKNVPKHLTNLANVVNESLKKRIKDSKMLKYSFV